MVTSESKVISWAEFDEFKYKPEFLGYDGDGHACFRDEETGGHIVVTKSGKK